VPALGGAPGVFFRALRRARGQQRTENAKTAFRNEGARGREQKRVFRLRESPRFGETARLAVVSEKVDGEILDAPARNRDGFGYDPVFFFPPLGKTFAELRAEEKSQHSHLRKGVSDGYWKSWSKRKKSLTQRAQRTQSSQRRGRDGSEEKSKDQQKESCEEGPSQKKLRGAAQGPIRNAWPRFSLGSMRPIRMPPAN